MYDKNQFENSYFLDLDAVVFCPDVVERFFELVDALGVLEPNEAGVGLGAATADLRSGGTS